MGDNRVASANTSLTIYVGGNAMQQAEAWKGLPPDERRRRAVEACMAHNTVALWRLTEVWTTLHGRAGALVSPHTRKNYRHGVETLVEAWGRENLLRPARDAAVLWLRQLEAQGLKPATVQIRLAAARALYGALRWAGATDVDPFDGVRVAADPTPAWEKRAPYSAAEFEALLAVAQGEDRALVLLAGHGGLRISECLALAWTDVELPQRRLVVARGKGGKRRTVPLSGTLLAALRALRPPDGRGYVLPYRSDFPARARIKRLTAVAQLPGGEEPGIPYRGIHALRHTCGTRLVRETGNLEMAARHLGHSSIETTRVYAKWSDDALHTTVGEW